jgi:hypothetical protein
METMTEKDLLDSLWRKRDKALERVVKIWLDDEEKDPEDLNKALDVLAVAHITAAAFEHASDSFSS